MCSSSPPLNQMTSFSAKLKSLLCGLGKQQNHSPNVQPLPMKQVTNHVEQITRQPNSVRHVPQSENSTAHSQSSHSAQPGANELNNSFDVSPQFHPHQSFEQESRIDRSSSDLATASQLQLDRTPQNLETLQPTQLDANHSDASSDVSHHEHHQLASLSPNEPSCLTVAHSERLVSRASKIEPRSFSLIPQQQNLNSSPLNAITPLQAPFNYSSIYEMSRHSSAVQSPSDASPIPQFSKRISVDKWEHHLDKRSLSRQGQEMQTLNIKNVKDNPKRLEKHPRAGPALSKIHSNQDLTAIIDRSRSNSPTRNYMSKRNVIDTSIPYNPNLKFTTSSFRGVYSKTQELRELQRRHTLQQGAKTPNDYEMISKSTPIHQRALSVQKIRQNNDDFSNPIISTMRHSASSGKLIENEFISIPRRVSDPNLEKFVHGERMILSTWQVFKPIATEPIDAQVYRTKSNSSIPNGRSTYSLQNHDIEKENYVYTSAPHLETNSFDYRSGLLNENTYLNVNPYHQKSLRPNALKELPFSDASNLPRYMNRSDSAFDHSSKLHYSTLSYSGLNSVIHGEKSTVVGSRGSPSISADYQSSINEENQARTRLIPTVI